MTNKLGSANPKNIPKPKKRVDKNTMLGEDLRQFNLDNTFNDILKNDRTLANRIDEIIRIKTKFTNTLNYFIDIYDKHQDYITDGGKDPKILKKCREVILSAKKGILQFQDWLVQIDELIVKEEVYVTKLLKDSGGKVDKYGVPQVISYEEYEKDFIENNRYEWLRRETKKTLLTDPIFQSLLAKYNPTDEDYDNSIEYVMGHLPKVMEKVGKHKGEGYQKVIKPLQALYDLGRLKDVSKKKGKKYFKKYHWDLMDDLQCYWTDKKFPIDPTWNQPYYTTTYFEHLAKKYDVHFKTIEAFARNNSPKKTTERIKKENK